MKYCRFYAARFHLLCNDVMLSIYLPQSLDDFIAAFKNGASELVCKLVILK